MNLEILFTCKILKMREDGKGLMQKTKNIKSFINQSSL